MQPRRRLRLIRGLLVATTILSLGVVLTSVWLIKIASAPVVGDSVQPEVVLTLPSPDQKFALVIRRLPAAEPGGRRLMGTIEDSRGALPGLPLWPFSSGELPRFSWSNHTVLLKWSLDESPRAIGQAAHSAAETDAPHFFQRWEWAQ